MKTKKTSFLIDFEYLLFLLMVKIASLIPLRMSYNIAGFCGKVFFSLDIRHRNRVIQHLMHAGVARNRSEAVALGRRNFSHFAKLLVEIVAARKMLKQEKIHSVLTVTGSEKSKELFFNPGKSKPVIIICAHFGNWEIAGPGYTMLSGIPLLSVMRPFDNPKIGEYIVGSRTGGTHEVCDKKGAVRPLLVALKKGYSIAILADQHAGEMEGVETQFFGHPARTHSSPALLHLKTGIPIMILLSRRVSDDFKFEFIISDPIEYKPTGDKEGDVKKLAQMYTSEVEKVIAIHPEQWMWAHRRWLDINRN